MRSEKKVANNKTRKIQLEVIKSKGISGNWQKVNHFFKLFDKEGPAEHWWMMLKLALIADNDNADHNDRSNLLFVYEETKELLKHIDILLQKEKKKALRQHKHLK